MEMKNPNGLQDLDLGQGNEALTCYQTVRISLDQYEAFSQYDGDVDALIAEAIDHYLEHLEDWTEPWCGPEEESGDVEYEVVYPPHVVTKSRGPRLRHLFPPTERRGTRRASPA